MKIDLAAFAGELPRLTPDLLPANNAQFASNVDLNRGKLEPFRTPLATAMLDKIGAIKTIYRFAQTLDSDSQFWFHWLNDTDVARGHVQADTVERTYFTEAGQLPKVTDATIATSGGGFPTASRDLGVPRPTGAPLLTVSGAASGDPSEVLAAYAFVNSRGEEGPLSPSSNLIPLYTGQTLTVQNMDGNPGGTWDVISKRIYLAQTGSDGYTAFRFLGEVGIGLPSQDYAVNFDDLGEEAASPSPLPPPTTLTNIAAHPNGFMVGIANGKFCRSDVFKPYAWPEQYQDPIAGDLVALAVVGASTVIATRQGCHLATGVDPLGQSIERLNEGQACVAKRTMKVTNIGAVYACPDGLVAVSPSGGSELVTRGIFTRDQWQALVPESMHAVVHDRRYWLFYDTGSERGGLIFDFTEGVGVVRTDVFATAAYSDPRRDSLFLVRPLDQAVYKWHAGPLRMPWTWRSRLYVTQMGSLLGAARVACDLSGGATATFSVYADGQLWRTRTITGNKPFRFKPKRANSWEFVLSGNARVTELHVAGTIEALAENG